MERDSLARIPVQTQDTDLETAPTVFKTAPTVFGTVPTVSGTVPTVSGTVPTVSGTVPTVSGTVPTVSGTVPTVHDTRETLAGSGGLSCAPVRRVLTEETIRAAAQGDPAALEAVARESRRSMLGGACRVLDRDVEDAQEAVNEAWFVILRRRGELAKVKPERLNACLADVAVCEALNRRRANRRQRRVFVSRDESPGEGEMEFAAPPGVDPAEMATALTFLGWLTDDQRKLLVLRYVEEWTVEEIATALECAGGTVRDRLRVLDARLVRLRAQVARRESDS